MKDLISVIIPVYKAEAYLHTCIDSALSQSYSNLEVILVDDGSPDNCPDICDSYAEKDTRVRVIHKTNGGASSARNAGLEAANGTYITFVDSDDVVAPKGLEFLHSSMEQTQAGYGAGICKIMDSNACKNKIPEKTYIKFAQEPQKVLKYITQAGSYSPYAKMYRGEIIRNYGLRFDESLKCSEDALFVRQYLLHCTDMVLVPEIVYEYNTNNDVSLSKKGYEMYCEYFIEKLKTLEQFCSGLPLSQQEKKWFLSYRAVHGLRISTKHYLTYWDSAEERVSLISKSIGLLSPWLDFTDTAISVMDEQTVAWWENKRKLVAKSRFDDYYACVMIETEKNSKDRFLIKIKRKIKKWIGR